MKRHYKYNDLSGKRFGNLFVKNRIVENKKTVTFLCLCDCGNETEVRSNRLIIGKTKSCGCLRKKAKSHGLYYKEKYTYRSWADMITRCYNKKSKHYKSYGGRGIKVCDRWRDSFENFFIDLGRRGKSLTLERIDVNGNYEPKNCKWITRKAQALNKRNTIYLFAFGEKITIPEASMKYNISKALIWSRVRKQKWSHEKALSIKKTK